MSTRRVQSAAACAGVVALAALGCGVTGRSPRASSHGEGEEERPAAEGKGVYDADGNERKCPRPEKQCPAQSRNLEFTDQCRLAGYRVQMCGCEELCTGLVVRRYYDAEGNEAECAPAQDDCSPPNAPASFQDACAEHGHHLKQCGCEAWLCSGDPTR